MFKINLNQSNESLKFQTGLAQWSNKEKLQIITFKKTGTINYLARKMSKTFVLTVKIVSDSLSVQQ